MSTAKHVQAPSPATSRKVKSMSTPGGIKFDPDCNLFHEACRNLGASQLWMLDKASVWSAYSGKHSHAQQNIFSLSSLTMDFMDQRIRHLFEEMIPEGEGIALGEGYFPQNATLNYWCFISFLGLAPFAFSLSSPEIFSAYPTFQLSSSQFLPVSALVGAVWLCSMEQSYGHHVLLQHPLLQPFPSGPQHSTAQSWIQTPPCHLVLKFLKMQLSKASWHKLPHM